MELNLENCVVVRKGGSDLSNFTQLEVVHYNQVSSVSVNQSSNGRVYTYKTITGTTISLSKPQDFADKIFNNYVAYMNKSTSKPDVIAETKEVKEAKKTK